VDVVHTNDGEFGFLGSLGKVDFLMNGGGPFQPGCDASVGLERKFEMKTLEFEQIWPIYT